jgi:hypothetical protein
MSMFALIFLLSLFLVIKSGTINMLFLDIWVDNRVVQSNILSSAGTSYQIKWSNDFSVI